MKILKKLFLVSLFCSLFIVRASASTELTFEYSDNLNNNMTTYSQLIDNVKQYLENNTLNLDGASFNLFSGEFSKPILIYDFSDISNNNLIVSWIYNHQNSNNFISNSFLYSNVAYRIKFNFYNNYNINSYTFSGIGYNYRFEIIDDVVNFNYYIDNSYVNDNQIYFRVESSNYDFVVNNVVYSYKDNILFSDLANSLNSNFIEPTYSYTSKVLDNGNVELTFSFKNYDSIESPYAFTIENEISGEEYGEENPFSSIFPKIIPFGESYSITIPYDTYLYVTLAKYNKVDDSTLYFREEIFTDVLDINNIVFSNPSNPYFSIDYQSKKFIQGRFNNTKNNDTCFVKFSNTSSSQQVSCTESFTINYDFNGFLTFYVKRNNDIIYTRNINILGNNSVDYPYITYNVKKQDFYSVVTFNVINVNYDINMSYRYSLDNGVTWTDYQLIEKEPFSYSINVFSNSNVIFEIANVRSPNNIIVYDSKSVYVVLDISTASGLNSSTDNIIDKFISLISINDNLINYINLLWNNFKNSKLFLIIMIPFISSIICGIIYLIRRK